MINIDFSPNSILTALQASKEALDSIDNLQQIEIPSNEDIESEIKTTQKEIDLFAKNLKQQTEKIYDELAGLIETDFRYKLNLFIQLLSKGLTEETFPISEWIEQRESLNQAFNSNDFKSLVENIKTTKDVEIKNNLSYEYFNMIKKSLNSNLSFKYNVGYKLFTEAEKLAQYLNIDKYELFEKLEESSVIKENNEYKTNKICSQANYWNIYSLLKTPDTDAKFLIDFISKIKDKKIYDFVLFLEKTDLFFERGNDNRIKSFRKESLRDFLFIAEDKEIRENFYSEFLISLEKIKNKNYLSKIDKENFEHVLNELNKGGHYLTLLNKLDKKNIEIKKNKI